MLRRICTTTAALALFTSTVVAQDDSPALAEITRLFDGLKLPGVTAKEMVLLNTGEPNPKKSDLPLTRRVGWLLGRTEGRLRLLHLDFRERTWSWPPDQRFERLDEVRAAGGPPPGTYVQVNYEAYCQAIRDEVGSGKPRVYDAMDAARFPVEVRAAQAAYWARQLGQPKLAEDMAALARSASGVDPGSSRPANRTLTGALVSRIVKEYRYRLTLRGHRGESPRELLWGWRLLAERLPKHSRTEVAKSMAAGYAALVAEHTAPAAPASDGASDAAVRYWLFMLRNQATRQRGQPGRCEVIRRWKPQDATPTPAEHLLALGRTAVPLLIEHLDDARPTRCITHGSVIGSVRLLRYGDCCLQILEAIRYGDEVSEQRIREYPHSRPSTIPTLKREWQAWWDAERDR